MRDGRRAGVVVLAAGGLALSVLLVAGQPRGLSATGRAQATPTAPEGRGDRSVSTVKAYVFNERGELVGPLEIPKVRKTEAEWKAQLTDEQYRITRGQGTERAFCGTLLDNKQEGVYSCVCCGLPLFSSDSKFHSGSGWPSFYRPIAGENIAEKTDRSFGMVRTEIECARCDAHLGHVFEDGPPPTGLRYCLNSEALTFTPRADLARLADPAAGTTERPTDANGSHDR